MASDANPTKKYLYVPKFPEDAENFKRVIDEFQKRAFRAPALLVLVLEDQETFIRYGFYWTVRVVGGSAMVQVVLKSDYFRQGGSIEALITQVDYYITAHNDKESDYVDIAHQNRKGILSPYPVYKIFRDIAVPGSTTWEKHHLLHMFNSEIVEKYPPDEYDYFLCTPGFGETTTFFFQSKQYVQETGKKILLFCVQESRKIILEASPYIDKVFLINRVIFDYIAIFMADRYRIKNFLQAYVQPSNEYFFRHPLPDKHQFDCNMASQMRCFLELPGSCLFEKFPVSIPAAAREGARQKFMELGLTRGRTVFIISDGLSFKMHDRHKGLFESIVRELNAAGFDTVTNSGEEIIPGCRFCFLPFWDCAAFVGLCGHIISIMTGLAEAVCSFNTTDRIGVHFLHGGEYDPMWRANSLMWYYRLKGLAQGGGSSVERSAISYHHHVKRMWGPNARDMQYILGETEAENAALVSQLVQNIVREGEF